MRAFAVVFVLLFAPITTALALEQTEPREGTVTGNDVRLHYLDFGGDGPAVVLLHGIGHTAHVYREFAPGLTDKYRVVALTRRGHGTSDAPPSGYDPVTLAHDIKAAMEALGIERAALIGHSMSGEEMTAFAVRWPDQVRALIYLDAAHDRSDDAVSEEEFFKGDPFVDYFFAGPSDRMTKETLRAFMRRTVPYWSAADDLNFDATARREADGLWYAGPAKGVEEAIAEGRLTYTHEYDQLQVPALAVYHVPRQYAEYETPPDATPEQRTAAQKYVDEKWRPWMLRSQEQFRMGVRCARIVEMPDTNHSMHRSHPAETLAFVRAFLATAHCPT